MITRRSFLQSSAAAAAFAASAGSARADNAPGVTATEIKIGQTMPYSGPASAYGVIGRTEAAYFKMINEQGGVNGRKINLISLDDAYSPPKTVEQVRRLSYGTLVLEESRGPATASEETARVLADAAVSAGIEKFVDPEALEQTLARIELLAQHFPDAGFAPPDQAGLRKLLAELCVGARSFADLRDSDVLGSIESRLTPEQARLWRTMTPDRVALPGNRQVRVQYARGKTPWIESRLQDFFGMAQGPSILGGRLMLVLHLLAPNQRAVQVTTDLAGFWERHYPALRKELSRRYPKHSWPEDPTSAQTPAQLGRRR